MPQVNLIPVPRQLARQRRRRIRRWISGGAIYAAVLLTGYGTLQTVWGSGGVELASIVASVQSEIDAAKSELSVVQPRLVDARLTLAASRAVGSQPDWSVLLALLAQGAGEQVALTSCELQPEAPPPPTTTAPDAAAIEPAATRYLLRVAGVGRDQAAIGQFVLRLEQTGLFEKVALIDARRQPFAAGDAIAFQIACTLGG